MDQVREDLGVRRKAACDGQKTEVTEERAVRRQVKPLGSRRSDMCLGESRREPHEYLDGIKLLVFVVITYTEDVFPRGRN